MQGSEATKHPADGARPSLPEGQKTGAFILVIPCMPAPVAGDRRERAQASGGGNRHPPPESWERMLVAVAVK